MENTTQETTIAVQPTAMDNVLSTIAAAASSKDVDVSKMQALLEMQKDIMATQARADYYAAMSACQSEMQRVVTSRENKLNKSKFARLDDIDSIARPVYTKHGFSLSFSSTETLEGFMTMTCVVMHRGGHETVHTKSGWRDDVGMKGEANKTRIQGSGSAGSYLRRYLTCDVFNIVTSDMAQQDNDGQPAEKFLTDAHKQIIISKLGGPGETVGKFCQKLGLGSLDEAADSDFDKLLARASTFINK